MNIDDIKQIEGIVEREAALSSMVTMVEAISEAMRAISVPLGEMMGVYRATSAVKLLFRSQNEETYTFAKERIAEALKGMSPDWRVHDALVGLDALCDVIRGWA